MTFKKIKDFIKNPQKSSRAELSQQELEPEKQIREVIEHLVPYCQLSVTLHNKVAVISVGQNSSAKSELFMKKDTILEKLSETLGEYAPREIRFR